MSVKGVLSGGENQQEGEGERRGYWRMKRIEYITYLSNIF
jgi:hypothetical protein